MDVFVLSVGEPPRFMAARTLAAAPDLPADGVLATKSCVEREILLIRVSIESRLCSIQAYRSVVRR
jgi:hypothetical protein